MDDQVSARARSLFDPCACRLSYYIVDGVAGESFVVPCERHAADHAQSVTGLDPRLNEAAAMFLPCVHLREGWCWPCVTEESERARRDALEEAAKAVEDADPTDYTLILAADRIRALKGA